MEIPASLKKLYRHWEFHTIPATTISPSEVFANPALFEDIAWFIHERIAIWKKKTSGDQAPYTNDPILSKYRFCNIFREFDRQTIFFHELLAPLRDDFPLWLLNMFYCRMVARPETIEEVGLLSFDNEKNERVYERLMRTSRPRFGTPYVFPISVIQRSEIPTRELFIAHHLPSIMRDVAGVIAGWKKQNVYDGVAQILPLFGYNLRFLWTEVLIDVAYQFPDLIDLFGTFPVGPGAVPTLEKISDRADKHLLVKDLARIDFSTEVTYNHKPLRLSAENWEGIACEYRKYTNLKSGKGRRRIFTSS
ncbi:MAG: hypothetical protein KBD16_01295 [Candidatus Pacebacteria bacterium]|nr:hypothetical protein [Candidatus Paceibacterota bacterium]